LDNRGVFIFVITMQIDTLYKLFLGHQAISTDTRHIREGSLFFALRGEKFDGNAFAREAITKGAAYAIVSDPTLQGPEFIQVADTLKTLQQLAKEHRQHLDIPVIGITGSNGKTTTKELLFTALSRPYRTHATQGNLNNHIGVPLTLLQVTDDIEILICEMGANHGGEIATLCQIANPTHGLITNIGKAHLEGFGSYEGVKKAKGELFDYLEAHGGFAFVNADDPALVDLGQSLSNKTSYGLKDDSHPDIHFSYKTKSGMEGFTLEDRNSPFQFPSSLFGFYNAANLLAAYVVGKHFGISNASLADSLASFTSGANRSEKVMIKGCTIIKDAYNANPSSMELAIQAFADLYPDGWVILGDMKELGETTREAHLQIIQKALAKKFSKIFLVGEAFSAAYLEKQSHDSRVAISKNIDELKSHWSWEECLSQYLLLKGSRSMQLEKLLA